MEKNDYILIQSWMVEDIGLSGNKLLIFAMIHGYCKDGEHKFFGSLDYISKWLCITKRCVIQILQELCSDGLLIKEDKIINNIKYCSYSLGGEKNSPPVKKVHGGGEKNSLGGEKNSPNNIIYNINTIKKDIDKSISKEKSDLFEQFWIAYNRKGSKAKAKEYFLKLDDSDIAKILPHINAYVSTREIVYQKDFERYLRDKIFLTIVYDKKNNIIYDPENDSSQNIMPQTENSNKYQDAPLPKLFEL